MEKKILSIIAIIIISFAGYFGGAFIAGKIIKIKAESQKAQVFNTETIQTEASPVIVRDTTLLFLGDMMFDRGVESSVNKNFGGDFSKLFDNIEEIKGADILFANLEGPVSDKGNNVGSKFSFEMNPSVFPVIKEAGFDIVSFANNHVGDWNVAAFKDTLARLEAENIPQTGAGLNKAEAEIPIIIERNGIKFGFLGLSDVGPAWMEAGENKPGILLANDPRLPEIIQNAKNNSDVLIVSIHWGDEYKKIHNTRQENLAKKIIDSGADLIIGHHPHVAQDIGEYKGKPIVYSLGNFIFDQYFSKDTMKGMSFEVTFNGTNIKNTESKTVVLNKKYQPDGIFDNDELKEYEESTSSTCSKPKKEYENMFLHPVGQDISLVDKTYIPIDLRELENDASTRSGICIIKEARDSFEELSAQAKKDGYIIKVSSGFRSFELQSNVRKTAIANGNKSVDIAIAKPGHSEHQIGTAIDITGKSIGYLTASGKFDNTEESNWLEENAAKYGFVQSYPKGKTDITGYMYEPWHYRFVGIGTAKEIIDSGKTVNEYLESLQ